MFINDVHKKEEVKTIATQRLRVYGIKYRPKKPRQIQTNNTKYGRKFFKVPLQNLNTQTVTLENGRQLNVPKLVHEMCSFILTKVETEGVFRKEGSKSRQNEIKLSLDRGCLLGDEHHVIDVAAVLKCFLRELPEPLIPSLYHELFLRSSIVQNKVEAILLACLLLPTEHLNVLSYLMEFFNEVAKHSHENKMTVNNLSILLGPNIFPIDEKGAPKSQHVLTKTCDIVKILIENSNEIGVIPEYIIEQVGNLPFQDTECSDKRKKKRRSGSLTRMFSGLKKIVSSNKTTDEVSPNIVTPDLLLTPSITRSVKKRKADPSGLSLRKKKDVLNQLPEAILLNTPFTPQRTPVCVNPNPKDKKEQLTKISLQNEFKNIPKEKKNQWYTRSKSMKSLKGDDNLTNRRQTSGKSLLERRWSAINEATNFRKKKRMSCNPQTTHSDQEKSETEPDYVKVSKMEYEEIKNRVSAIERTISTMEINHLPTNLDNKTVESQEKNIEKVQTAYEQTLVQTGQLNSPTTDHLARRLSRELRIRRNSEQKIIRSPSARKIGSMRRRSRELEKHTVKLTRNQSWHVPQTTINLPRVNLTKSSPVRKPITRSSSYNSFNLSNSLNSCNTSNSSTTKWTSAEGFFANLRTPTEQMNDRASLAKLRSQNAGMVMAKAKLFDNLYDSNTSTETDTSKKSIKSKSSNKIGATRNTDARMSYRIRAIRCDERRAKKSMSPRRRNGNLSHRQRIHIAKQLSEWKNKENNDESMDCDVNKTVMDKVPLREVNRIVEDIDAPLHTPKNVPKIKKSITVKSPKRLCRTPQNFDRTTPMKVINTAFKI